MKRIILHIGTEKTGSSSIQRMLSLNSDRLSTKHGLSYSRRLGNTLWRLVTDPAKSQKYLASIDQTLGELRSEDAVLCSAELLHSRLPDAELITELRTLLKTLGFDEFQVVVYLRRQAEIANSMASTAVQWDKEQLQEPLSPYLNVVCDHRATLTNWSAAFGPQSITPRLFEPSEFTHGSLEQDFLTAIGIKRLRSFKVKKTRNQQISHTGIEIMRQVNAVLTYEYPQLDWSRKRDLRQAVYRKSIEPYFTNPKYSQAGHLWRYYDRAYAEGNEWVRGHYFPYRSTLFATKPIPEQTYPLISEETARSVAQGMVRATIQPAVATE
jgi:hypothetical protein